MADEPEFLCDGWAWDAALRELRHYPRRRKGQAAEPDGVERLKPVRTVTWHRWAQPPMQTHTGEVMPGKLSRVVAAFEGGGDLTINESDRECAGKLAQAIASAYGLTVVEAGAPTGRRAGNLPARDERRRLVTRAGKTEVVLDEAMGEIHVTTAQRLFRKSQRTYRLSEVKSLELGYDVQGPLETVTVWAVTLPEGEKVPLASYQGYEGWADLEEWLAFAQELGRSLNVPVTA